MVMTSTLGYCEVSSLFLGKKDDIGRSIDFGWSYRTNELSIEKRNRYAQLFADVILRQRQINCSIKYMDKDNLDEFFNFYDRCGETKPFFVKIGCDEMTNDHRRYSGMYFLESVPQVVNPFFNKFNVSLSLLEAT
jgi:hypothetical protein